MNVISKQLIRVAREYLARDYKKERKLQEVLDRMLYKDYDDKQKLNYVKLVCKYHEDLIRQVMDTISFSSNNFAIKAYIQMAKIALQDIRRDQLNDCKITKQQLKLLDPNQSRFQWHNTLNEVVDSRDHDLDNALDDDDISLHDSIDLMYSKFECKDCGAIWSYDDLDKSNGCPLCNGSLKRK